MTSSDHFHWDLGELPFMWNPLRTPHNPEGLPDALPFTLGVSVTTGALVQKPNALVSAALARAYALGSMITGQMDESGIGRGYADDFLAFMAGPHGGARFAGKRVLEVGCGNGYLLTRLRALGSDVIGLEPGEHGQSKYDVPIIRDFFPSPAVTGKFDAIVMFGVLEHVEDPRAFLAQIFAFLAPGGEVLLGVPDCGPYIEAGDLSCLIHEHWSYFDEASFARALRSAGGVEVEVSRGTFGGMLYARASVAAEGARTADAAPDEGVARAHDGYRARAERMMQAVAQYVAGAAAARKTVGIYVPGRVINTLFAGRVTTEHCRFFDDNPLLKGTFFPGLPITIEDRAALVSRPTDQVLVMSRSFSGAIAKELAQALPASVSVDTWHTLFEPRA